MKHELEEALQALHNHSNSNKLPKLSFYESLLEEDLSRALEKLSFVECCGLLSLYYNDNNHYPILLEGDIYKYLREANDYHVPLGLLTLSDLNMTLFSVGEIN